MKINEFVAAVNEKIAAEGWNTKEGAFTAEYKWMRNKIKKICNDLLNNIENPNNRYFRAEDAYYFRNCILIKGCKKDYMYRGHRLFVLEIKYGKNWRGDLYIKSLNCIDEDALDADIASLLETLIDRENDLNMKLQQAKEVKNNAFIAELENHNLSKDDFKKLYQMFNETSGELYEQITRG